MQLKQLLDIILCEEFEFTSEKSPERYHMARKGQRVEERRVQVHAFGEEKNDFKRRCTLLQCKKKNGREPERYKKLNMERDFHCFSRKSF